MNVVLDIKFGELICSK